MDKIRHLYLKQSEIDNFVKNILNIGKTELLADPLVQRLIILSMRQPRTRKIQKTEEIKVATLPSEEKIESAAITQKPEEKPTEAALPKPYTPPPLGPLEAQEDLSKWFEDRRKRFGEIK